MKAERYAPTLLLLASACAGAPVHATGSHGARLDGPRLPAGRVRASTLVVPPIGAPRSIARETTGAAYYAVGGVRVRLRNGDAVVAEQPFASTLIGAVRTSDGQWLMVAGSGTIARAADWVGPMRYIRTLGAPVARAFAWQGSLVAVFANGHAVRVDPVGHADVAMPASVLTSPEAAPRDVPEDEATTVAHAALTTFPDARIALPSAALLPSGALVLLGGEYLHFVATTRAGGFTTRARVALAGEPAGDCALSPWGSRALLTCAQSGGRNGVPVADVFAADEAGDVVEVAHARAGTIIAGREGHTLTIAGPCVAGESIPEGVTVACTMDRDRPFREWQFPVANAHVLDVYDARALLAVPSGDEGTSLVLYEIDTARQHPVVLSDPTAELDRAGFGPDGRVLVLARSGSNARVSRFGVAREGEMVTLRSLGFLAADVGMGDARHGLAVGADASAVARTSDGGANWGRVEVAIDGDLVGGALLDTPGELNGVQRIGTRIDCGPTVCRAGRLVHFSSASFERVPAMQ